MNESAAVKLDLVDSLLTSIAASLTSSTGVPSATATANSLLGVQLLVAQAKRQLDA
jgi:hypothetical protein